MANTWLGQHEVNAANPEGSQGNAAAARASVTPWSDTTGLGE